MNKNHSLHLFPRGVLMNSKFLEIFVVTKLEQTEEKAGCHRWRYSAF